MDLRTYISDTKQRRQLAEEVGTSPDYLWQIATGWRGKRASRTLSIAIENATGGEVPRGSLREDIWPPEKDGADAEAETT